MAEKGKGKKGGKGVKGKGKKEGKGVKEKGKKDGKGVKGKGKKAGKGVKGKRKKKQRLSNLERETFRLTIEDLENKIEWRREMCLIIKEDIKLYEEAYQEERQDKKIAIHCLEKAIEDQRKMREKIETAIPDNEKLKLQTVESQSRDLAMTVLRMNEEKRSNDKQLGSMQKKLRILEMYDSKKVDEKINEIESQLNAVKSDSELLRESEKKRHREKALRAEMLEIFKEKSSAYQAKLRGSLDPTIEKITEETRWYEDSGNILCTMRERLDKDNQTKVTSLMESKENIRRRKEATLKTSAWLRKQKKKIVALEKNNLELLEIEKDEAYLKAEVERLRSLMDNAKDSLDALKYNLHEKIQLLEHNEKCLNNLENQLSETNKFGQYLAEVKERIEQIIQTEVEYSRIKTYDGPPEKKNMIKELVSLLDNASKHIYEQLKT